MSFFNFLFRPVDAASLAIFRIVFGCAVLADVLRYLTSGTVHRYWIAPQYHFTYYPFDWVQPLPGPAMYAIFVVLAVCGALIALGLCYRIACLTFGLLFTYAFLCEQAIYLNHFYLISTLSLLMACVPAHRLWSLDAWLSCRVHERSEMHLGPPSEHRCNALRFCTLPTIPNWALWTIRGQLFICYFYGGLAKLNADWLQGEPMRIRLAERGDFPLVGRWFLEPGAAWFFSYGGLLLDLLIVPLLLWKRTRWAMAAGAFFFHLMNSQLFPIGIFPWLMIGATTIFLPADWPRKVLGWLRGQRSEVRGQEKSGGETTPYSELSTQYSVHSNGYSAISTPSPSPSLSPSPTPLTWALLALLALHFTIQLLAPFRHYAYPGDASWTEEGHLFAWRMKLRDKRGHAAFVVTDRRTGQSWRRDPYLDLPRFQASSLIISPDLIWQHAQHLAAEYRAAGHADVTVCVESSLSLNGRPPQPLVDPAVNLAAQPRPRTFATWVVPLQTPLPRPDETLRRIVLKN